MYIMYVLCCGVPLPPSFLLQVITRFASAEQKEYAGAGAVAEEILSSIRTVIAFGGEYKEAARYVLYMYIHCVH